MVDSVPQEGPNARPSASAGTTFACTVCASPCTTCGANGSEQGFKGTEAAELRGRDCVVQPDLALVKFEEKCMSVSGDE